MNRGDVVLADFPYQDVAGSKVRPAVVVQNDADNQALPNTILAMITGNLADKARTTNVLIDPATPDGTGSGFAGAVTDQMREYRLCMATPSLGRNSFRHSRAATRISEPQKSKLAPH